MNGQTPKLIVGGALLLTLATHITGVWVTHEQAAGLAGIAAEKESLQAEAAIWRASRNRAVHERDAALKADHLDPANSESFLANVDRQGWLDRTRRLRQLLAEKPEMAIPEIRLLSDLDWLGLGRHAHFEPEAALRETLARVRTSAKVKFAAQLSDALGKYLAAHGDQLPGNLSELIPFFPSPPAPDLLARYYLTRAEGANGTPSPKTIEEQNQQPDPEYDSWISIPAKGGYSMRSGLAAEFYHGVTRARNAYQTIHGHEAPGIDELMPYLNFDPPLDEAAQQRFLKYADAVRTLRAKRTSHANGQDSP